MAWPLVAPAPVVTDHPAVFRDRLDHQGQVRQFQHELTGLIVRPHTRLATRARGRLARADNTPLSRVLAAAPGREDAVTRRRLRCMLQQTTPPRRRRREARVVWEETLGDQVGRRGDAGDRHDHPRDGTAPLAHHPVPSWSVHGPGRFPLGLRR
jgi:hypothetical protein